MTDLSGEGDETLKNLSKKKLLERLRSAEARERESRAAGRELLEELDNLRHQVETLRDKLDEAEAWSDTHLDEYENVRQLLVKERIYALRRRRRAR